MDKKIFVANASGIQGSKIAATLIEEGYAVSTLIRTKQVLKGLDVYVGDLNDMEVIEAALKGVKAAVYTFPMIFDKEVAINYTTNFIKACEKTGVDLVIFNAASDLPKSETGLLALDMKLLIENLFQASELNVITLVPDIYIDNLAAPWSIPVILENGILPYPIASEQAIPWISHLDLAKYVVAALKNPNLAGQQLPIVSNCWTGEEIATTLSTHLDRKVNFVSLSPDEFEAQLAPTFGELTAKEVSNIYRHIKNKTSSLLEKDFKRTQELLSVKPQTLTEWVGSIIWEN
ncbi:MAG: NmrA family NAD(P)-binding protein [Aureispira sp.]|nr:NmrA family NAD(P)-binding protein [Aureispira sp.]